MHETNMEVIRKISNVFIQSFWASFKVKVEYKEFIRELEYIKFHHKKNWHYRYKTN